MALFAQPLTSSNNNIGDMNGYTSSANDSHTGQEQSVTDSKSVLSSVPAWGSYLYQNFLLPAFSPSEWLNTNNTPMAPAMFNDYFGDSQTHQKWDVNSGIKVEPGLAYQQAPVPAPPQPSLTMNPSSTHPSFPSNTFSNTPYSFNTQEPTSYYASSMQSDRKPSAPSYYSTQTYPYQHNFSQQSLAGPSMPTSLLLAQTRARGSDSTTQTLDAVDAQCHQSPSPPVSSRQSPNKRQKRSRRASSTSSDEHEQELEVEVDMPEGVERDGMIWGMRVENYRALSARERKRIRNRISARTFRAKRKEHLTSLESTLGSKDLQIKLANEEAARLRKEILELKRRLAVYEG